MTDFKTVVRVLAEGGVEFIVVGGLAGIMHGSARLTFDDVDRLAVWVPPSRG